MAFQKKTWKNRLSEYPLRRTLTPTDGSSPFQVDVTRAEGTIMEQGDAFNADNMNDLEDRIEQGIGGGDENLAPIEENSESSANAYSVGQLLLCEGQLERVTAPIAVGNSIVEGVNVTPTTAGEEIVSRNNALISELTANGNQIYFDYQNGKYGINTSPTRGADTFIPFKGPQTLTIRVLTSGNNYGDFTTKAYVNGTLIASFSGDMDPGYVYSNTWEQTVQYTTE